MGLTVLEGTTFESSTCDYSDDLQILLESEGGKTTREEQMKLKHNRDPGRMLADNTDNTIASFTLEWLHYERKGGWVGKPRERQRERGRESSNLATVVAKFLQMWSWWRPTGNLWEAGGGGGRDEGAAEGNREWVSEDPPPTHSPMQYSCQSSMLLTCTCGSNTEHLASPFPADVKMQSRIKKIKINKKGMPAAELKCPPQCFQGLLSTTEM